MWIFPYFGNKRRKYLKIVIKTKIFCKNPSKNGNNNYVGFLIRTFSKRTCCYRPKFTPPPPVHSRSREGTRLRMCTFSYIARSLHGFVADLALVSQASLAKKISFSVVWVSLWTVYILQIRLRIFRRFFIRSLCPYDSKFPEENRSDINFLCSNF